MHEFGQKGRVPLAERLSLSPLEASALTGIGTTSIRQAINEGTLNAHKHGKRTIILPDDLKAWLRTLPHAGKRCDLESGEKSVSEDQNVA